MKPTASGRLVNYHSTHPTHQKVNIVTNMLYRAFTLSSAEFIEPNVQRIKNLLKENNYPRFFVNKIIHQFFHPKKSIKSKDLDDIPNSRWTFPNIPGLASKLQKLMLKEGKSQQITYNIKSTKCLFSQMKDQANRNEMKEIVYKINCAECEKVYIGETRQKISSRIKQHKNTCKPTYCGGHTALSSHSMETSHQFDFDAVECLGRESNEKKRRILETIHIIKTENTTNFKSDTENLSSIYNYVLRKF